MVAQRGPPCWQRRFRGCFQWHRLPLHTYIHTYIEVDLIYSIYIHTYICLTVLLVHLRCESLVRWIWNAALVIQNLEDTHSYIHTYIHTYINSKKKIMYVCMGSCYQSNPESLGCQGTQCGPQKSTTTTTMHKITHFQLTQMCIRLG